MLLVYVTQHTYTYLLKVRRERAMGRSDNATRSSWIAACRRGSGLRRTRSMARHPYYYIHTGNTRNTPYMPRIHAGGQPAEKHTSKWGPLGKTGQMGVFLAFCNTTKCTNDFFGDFFCSVFWVLAENCCMTAVLTAKNCSVTAVLT